MQSCGQRPCAQSHMRQQAQCSQQLQPSTSRCRSARPYRSQLVVNAELVGKGRSVTARQVNVKKLLSQGSFGEVFQGVVTTPAGEEEVVMKRAKKRVQGAEEMGMNEHLLNVYATRVVKGHCAEFVGYCDVPTADATTRLTSGLWLMWKYEGSKTLGYYLKRRDCIRALATDLEVPEAAVIPTVMRNILENLEAFHGAGLVHRDIKPANIIYSDETQRFKLIDLGACVDLRSGTNYVPDESILDYNYCPPEQYVLPTDSPHLSKEFFKLAISPVMWARHKPDRFDSWSAGMVMLQLALPPLRRDQALKNFNAQYGDKYKYDLTAWRKATTLSKKDTEYLDADGGAGWDLLQSLLAPRRIKVHDDNSVTFVSEGTFPRLSASEALKHRFIKAAAVPGSVPAYGSTLGRAYESYDSEEELSATGNKKQTNESRFGGGASGLWRNLTDRLFDLEAKLTTQATATQKQTSAVKNLRKKVAAGQAAPDVLQQEEKRLGKMEKRLQTLSTDFNATTTQASGLLRFFGFGGGPAQAAPTPSGSSGSAGARRTSSSGSSGSSVEVAPAPRQPMRWLAGPSQNDVYNKQMANRSGSSGKGGSSGRGSSGRSASPGSGGRSKTGRAPVPAGASAAEGQVAGSGFSGWFTQLSSTLASKLSNQAEATSKQYANVDKLRQRVAAGQEDAAKLQRAERTLSKMQRRLKELDQDFSKVKKQVSQASSGQRAQDTFAVTTPDESSSSPRSTGSFWDKMWQVGTSGTGGNRNIAAAAAASAATPVKSSTAGIRAQDPIDNTGTLDISSGRQISGSGFLANGLKLGGFAAKMATGLAASIQADAQKAMKKMEADAEARRQQRDSDAAFMALLKEQPHSATASFDSSLSALSSEPRWVAVEQGRRRALWLSHQDAANRLAKQESLTAEANLKALYRRCGLTKTSTWESVQAMPGLATDTAFIAVLEEARLRLFEEVMDDVRLQTTLVEAAMRAEDDFKVMLSGITNPPISPNSTWPLVKPQMWTDLRYQALPEARRRALFDEYHAAVCSAAAIAAEMRTAARDAMHVAGAERMRREAAERAAARAAAAEAAGASADEILLAGKSSFDEGSVDGEFSEAGMMQTVAEQVAWAMANAEPQVDVRRLEALEAEKERMRQEYESMAQRLQEMEARLKAKEELLLAGGAAPVSASALIQPQAPTATPADNVPSASDRTFSMRTASARSAPFFPVSYSSESSSSRHPAPPSAAHPSTPHSNGSSSSHSADRVSDGEWGAEREHKHSSMSAAERRMSGRVLDDVQSHFGDEQLHPDFKQRLDGDLEEHTAGALRGSFTGSGEGVRSYALQEDEQGGRVGYRSLRRQPPGVTIRQN